MAINASKVKAPKGDRVEQPDLEPATYPGRLVQVIDLGLQPQRPFQGQEKAPANEIMLTYELVDTFMIDKDGKELEDKPRWQSETLPLYNLSQDKAKSTQRYHAIDPNEVFGGDFSKLLAAPINVTLTQTKKGDKVYTNVAGIAPMRAREADKLPELKNPAKVFDLDDPDMETFKSLPDWIQEKIKGNLNFNGSKLQAALGGKQVEKEPAKAEVKKEEVAPDNGVDVTDAPWD